ncbi:uncharacterized protein LOC119721739 [Patiria miniata]|uniref:Peptidase aspartic putative domain-containing protein n=1 Tax=Patiria miniata TaxID=46514 RepID=A0A913Z751_PATMI|nr:uncharacterized protein LOC119721739 [Patiria miniata]
MDPGRPPSIRSGISHNSSARSSRSEIVKRLAEQESRRKLEELRRKADEEKARVQFQAMQRGIEIDSDYRQAEIQVETERLQHELDVVEQEEQNQMESGHNLPGRDESIKNRTSTWVNNGVSISEPTVFTPADTNTSVNPCTYMPVSAPLLQPSIATSMTSYVSHGAASAQATSSLPHSFNPNLPAFLPNTMLVQSLPTVRLFNGVPVAQFPSTSGAPTTKGLGGQCSTQRGPPSQQPAGNDKGPGPPTSRADVSSGEEQSEPSSSGDDDPSEGDRGNKHSCCPKGTSKATDKPLTPVANASNSPVTAFTGPYGCGFGIWDSLPKLDIPKFDSEHDVRQYVTFRTLWDSIMKGPMCHLPEATKFTYLRSHLGGRPLAIADRNLILGDGAYAATMKQFHKAYGDPARIIQGLLDQLESRPVLAHNDWSGLRDFSDELATAVETAEKFDFRDELKHHRYATELVKKLPERLHSEFLSKMWNQDQGIKYTVHHLSQWLKKKTGPAGLILLERASKSKSTRESSPWKSQGQKRSSGSQPHPSRSYMAQAGPQSTAATPTIKNKKANWEAKAQSPSKTSAMTPERITCLYCKVKETGHYLETCEKFKGLKRDQKLQWLTTNQRCRKCAKKHEKDCLYPKKCEECHADHRTSLHELNEPTVKEAVLCSGVGPSPRVDYNRDVLIKVVPLTVHGPGGSIDTFGVLDECAERTMVLQSVVEQLDISGHKENLCITTVMGDTRWKGECVNFQVSARGDSEKYAIQCAFTAPDVQLVDYSVCAEQLQDKWPHLRGLALFSAHRVQPSVLIGADHVELTLSSEARSGPKSSSPVAVNTLFGWTVLGHQGLQIPGKTLEGQRVLFTSCTLQQPDQKLHQMMEQFMTVDKLPQVNEKQATRSRNDKLAISILEENTKEVEVDGVKRLETPLLWKPNHQRPSNLPQAVLALARSNQRKIERNPDLSDYCRSYIQKLQDQGQVRNLGPVDDLSADQQRGWYIPCHVVHSSGKNRLFSIARLSVVDRASTMNCLLVQL